MKRSGILRKTPLRSGTRKPSETERIYGPAPFREWIHAQPCIITRLFGVQQVHVKNGGMSRKAGYEWSVPMSAKLHYELHRIGIRSFEAKYDVDLELAAIAAHQKWLAHVARGLGA